VKLCKTRYREYEQRKTEHRKTYSHSLNKKQCYNIYIYIYIYIFKTISFYQLCSGNFKIISLYQLYSGEESVGCLSEMDWDTVC